VVRPCVDPVGPLLHLLPNRILLLVKDTSAKLKSLTESDHDANANVCSTSFLSFNLMLHV